jgi:phosphoglycerate kinase
MGFIKSMLKHVDKLLIGGAMTYTFMLAKGQTIGNSKAEADKVDLAKELLTLGGDKIVLPVDHLTADKPDASTKTTVVEGQIPAGAFGMDIGPKTIAAYTDLIKNAGTVVWNGPLGKFGDEPFANGTKSIAHAMTQCKGTTIVGGGETAEAVETFGLDTKMTHVSTGGGAFLEYVEGTPFKALSVIDEK